MNLVQNINVCDDNVYNFNMDTDIAVVKYIIPLGFSNFIQRGGYAHLIEHMIIQENKNYLSFLEKNGIQFNAETKDSMTEYIFIDLKNNLLLKELEEGTLNEIFHAVFKQNSLDIEKKTIKQEHLLLCNKIEEEEVDSMIGTADEIANFDLKKLTDIKEQNYQKYDTIIFGNRNKGKAQQESMDISSWFDKLNFLQLFKGNDNVTMILEDTIYSEILTYFLRILFCDFIKNFELSVQRNNQQIKIEIEGNLEDLKEVITYKENSYHYYYILLTSFKFLCSEVTYVTRYLNQNFDIEEAYFNEPWEEKFCEKIFNG